jgi:ATP-binding cassette subfamily B protein
LIRSHQVAFRYPRQAKRALDGIDLQISRGERVLLEGPSGGGKSSLVALLTGLHAPEAGQLLLQGVDIETLGAKQWRRQVVAAPQFHENHVLSETFAFNLLMGRRWPPIPEDMRDAQTICAELGLTDLLTRMPSGMYQWVGDSGWQLSHGERSRLYIARALLQDAELVVLDESFAALDPSSLEQAMDCVFRRATTLIVIAHP